MNIHLPFQHICTVFMHTFGSVWKTGSLSHHLRYLGGEQAMPFHRWRSQNWRDQMISPRSAAGRWWSWASNQPWSQNPSVVFLLLLGRETQSKLSHIASVGEAMELSSCGSWFCTIDQPITQIKELWACCLQKRILHPFGRSALKAMSPDGLSASWQKDNKVQRPMRLPSGRERIWI